MQSGSKAACTQLTTTLASDHRPRPPLVATPHLPPLLSVQHITCSLRMQHPSQVRAYPLRIFFLSVSIVVSVKSQLASIAQRATQAHCHVTGLTRDVQELDTTKQNLALTIEVLLMLHSNVASRTSNHNTPTLSPSRCSAE